MGSRGSILRKNKDDDISFLLFHLVVGVYSDILLVFGEIDIYVAKDYWLFSTKIIKIRIYEICIIYSKSCKLKKLYYFFSPSNNMTSVPATI